MSVLNGVVAQINKAMQKAAANGDTRFVNKLTTMAETSSEIANRLEQVKVVNNEWKEAGVDTEQYIHRSRATGIDEGNIRSRAGTTPAAAGKGEGVFATPVGYADETKAFGKNEYIMTTEAADAPKLGQGQMELAAGSQPIPETFIPTNQLQEMTPIKPLGREDDMALKGLPRGQDIGQPGMNIGPDLNVQKVAGKYMQKSGLEYNPPIEYKKVDPRFSRKVANAFENMKHEPENPHVKEAYDAMITETSAQYDELVKGGLKLEFIKPGQADPYPNPRMMTEDVKANNHMWIFPTDQGFGADVKYKGNPLLNDSGYTIGGQKAVANDIFRAVHDYFGHVKEGVGFRADGEENAFLSHSSMFSPKAQRALATETRGQNSWLNWGPEGKRNRTATTGNTIFADQKIGLLPKEFTDVSKSVHLPVAKTMKPHGEMIIDDLSKFTENFKGSLAKMRKSNKVKSFFEGKNLSDRIIAGMGIDVLKMLEQNSAGKFRRVDGVKIYERLSQQDLLDKIGRRLEVRLMSDGDERMTSQSRRELGAIMLEYAKGNFGRFISEDMVKTANGQKLYMTTNSEFKQWAKSGGRVIMKAFDDIHEARQPSTTKSHGDWKADAEGNITEAPEGSDPVDFLAGGEKTNLSESVFPSVIKSLNTLGGMRTGMNKDFFSIWKNLGKKGYFNESAGPIDEFKAQMEKSRLTTAERAELGEAYDVVNIKGSLDHSGPMTKGQFRSIQEEIFTPRLKALDAIRAEVTTSGDQRIAKQSSTRRLREELDRRFDENEDGGAFFQYNVDSRGRAYPVDGSGASINSGGAIRHGFTGETKPIQYGDEGFKQIVDDMVLFDSTALKLNKIEGTGLQRHAHWIKNEAKYLKEGNEALDNAEDPSWNPLWLRGQKDKGPYLAAVMEIARVKRASDKGIPHESNMMIEIDAPSSGSQHIGAQYGDQEILWQTSVLSEPEGMHRILNADEIADLKAGVPDDSIARDLYTEIGNIYKKKRDIAFSDLEATDPQKAAAFRRFTEEYISSGRDITKPIVMKVPYGAGDDSLRKDMVKQLSGRQRLEMADAGVDPEELMDFHWDSMKGALNEGLATQMEFKKFNKALGKIYSKATGRKPFKVIGPDGGTTDLTRYTMDSVKGTTFKIKGEGIPDLNVDERQIRIYEAKGKVDKSALGVKGYEVDTQQLAQGLSPNITHSMDAAYLHRLVNAATEEGINLRVVHDAFFAHPNDVSAIKQLAGQVFQDMHANYDFRSEMIKGLSKSTGESVESITSQLRDQGINLGRDFDIGQVPSEQLGNIIRGG